MASHFAVRDPAPLDAEDHGIFAQRAAARERARAIAQEHQYILAEELSRITSDEYQDDILSHMEQMEIETLPDVNSIDIQTEIQWFMRPYLLDFLVEAHAAFQLHPETLYLTVNLLDRYCSKRVVYKRHYQLVGCAALLIAAKYGDRKDRVPTVRELKSMCCNLYEEEMFTQMEWHVLVTLDWAIGHPTVDSFLQIALSEIPYDRELEHMTWYLCEIALFYREFVSVPPSVMARSALSVARYIMARPIIASTPWSSKVDPIIRTSLAQKLRSPSSVLYKKYSSTHFCSVAQNVEAFLRRQDEMQLRMQPHTPLSFGASYRTQQAAAMGDLAAPHTPQKGLNPPNVAYGYITPPITPESSFASQNVYTKPGNTEYQDSTPVNTLTPPSIMNTAQCQYYVQDADTNSIAPLPVHEY